MTTNTADDQTPTESALRTTTASRHATDDGRAASRTLAARIVDRALARNDSILTGQRRLWTAAECDALSTALTAAARDGDGQFKARWAALIARAPEPTRLLAMEVLAVHLWYPNDIGTETKLAYFADAAAFLDRPFRLSKPVRDGIVGGVSGSGTAYGVRRLSQLAFLTRAVAALKELRPKDRRATLEDPWRWKAHLWSVPVEGGHAQREVLLHLVHPDTFEPIVSPRIKRELVIRFADHIGDDLVDVDARLALLRQVLLADHPERPLIDLLDD